MEIERLGVAHQVIENRTKNAIDIARQIWENPEPAYQEEFSSHCLGEALKKEGFRVEYGYAGVPTAFRAEYGHGKPVIGLLSEYDALPGLSQKVSRRQEPVPGQSCGHGCGHNLQPGTIYAAAVGIKEELEHEGIPGTVVVYGCPGEEVLTGKVFMVRGGAFKELDCAFCWHSGDANAVATDLETAALDNVEFIFRGTAAHAAMMPWKGRSASDAVELMCVGANYLREHICPDIRLHYTITNGGKSPNIVADYASVWYYIRGMRRGDVAEVYERLKDIAKGAALMAGVQLEVKYNGGCYGCKMNSVLGDILLESGQGLPEPVWSPEELDYAQELNRVNLQYQAGTAKETVPLRNGWSRPKGAFIGGSSDMGDVTRIVPCGMINTCSHNSLAQGHSWQITACAGHTIGQKGMIYGAHVLADAAMKLYRDAGLMQRVQEEFQKNNIEEYICPIPDEIPVPGTEI